MRQRGIPTVVALGLLAGCDGCLATDECPGFIHRIDRLVTVDDTRDTIRVGDTVTFSVVLPWVVTTHFSYELQDSFTFDLRDAPNPTGNFTGWFPLYAPLGSSQGLSEPRFAIGDLDWVVRRGGDGTGYLPGDSTETGLEAELSVIFSRPGRYYLVFVSEREGQKRSDTRDPKSEYDAYDLTRTDGCRERIYIHNKATNYHINDAAIDAQNAASEVQLRVRRGVNDDKADYYVLVTE